MTSRMVSRRGVLAGGLALPAVAGAEMATPLPTDPFAAARLMADVEAYAGAGNKQSGGAGDCWTADWVAERLAKLGFVVERQVFEVPWFEATRAELLVGDIATPLVAQPLVTATPTAGLGGELRLVDEVGRLDGAIALLRLPHRRWSSLTDRAVRVPVDEAVARGAAAVLVVTTGPTGEALLLNAPADRPAFLRPVVLLAPSAAAPLVEAARAHAPATLYIGGNGGKRQAENVIGRRVVDDKGRWLAVSTPRSGWTDCAGERGPGLAIWLALADWAVRAYPRRNLLFVCNSGHEYENLGASHIVEKVGPRPADTDFWLHLGANVAARDWHELPGRLLPLPSADPNRFLVTSADLVASARTIFKGQPGLEMAYPSDAGAAGELVEVIKAGYQRYAGVFGAHRHHHAATDTISAVAPAPIAAAALAFRDLVAAAL